MDGVVNLTVDNPAPDFILKNASGHIKHKDKDFLVVSASDLFVEGRSTKEYRVPLRGELAPGLTTLSFLGTIGTSGLSEYTIDINATVSTKSGFKKDIEYKNIPLEEAIKLF